MPNNGQNDNQQQPNIDGCNILSQLFSRLDELSNAISPRAVDDQCRRSDVLLEARLVKKVPQISQVYRTLHYKFIM